jgi:hypothetical protein
MYNQLKPTQELSAGIISFKNFSKGFISFAHKIGRSNIQQVITPAILSAFEIQLAEIIKELYNPEIPLLEKEV